MGRDTGKNALQPKVLQHAYARSGTICWRRVEGAKYRRKKRPNHMISMTLFVMGSHDAFPNGTAYNGAEWRVCSFLAKCGNNSSVVWPRFRFHVRFFPFVVCSV